MASAPEGQKAYSLVGKNLKLTSEEDIAPYLAEIKAIDGLQEIHLGGNTLGVGACQALGKVLKETTQDSLRVADFADIFTGRLISEIPDALRALCDALVEHTVLEEIDLSDNAFGGRSAEPMVNFLTNNHVFSVLKLNNNGLGITGGEIVANALLAAAEALKAQGKPSALKTVICGRNRLEDGSAPFWAKAYAAHKNLEEVRMFQNGIRMDGIVALSQGLSDCANLRVLDLQDNTATVRGSRGIAQALPSWSKLEVLNLSDCLLKPKGGYLVIDALHKGQNANVQTLQLQYCDLDRKALARLGSAIDSGALKNVEKLEINGNWADEDDECIEQIKTALGKYDHEDALDELDEMDPEGEEEEEEEDGEGDAEAEDKEDGEETTDKAKPVEVAAAAVAAPAATLAVAGGAAVAAATHTKDTVDGKLQDLSLNDQPQKESIASEDAQDSRKAQAIAETKEAEAEVKEAAETGEIPTTTIADDGEPKVGGVSGTAAAAPAEQVSKPADEVETANVTETSQDAQQESVASAEKATPVVAATQETPKVTDSLQDSQQEQVTSSENAIPAVAAAEEAPKETSSAEAGEEDKHSKGALAAGLGATGAAVAGGAAAATALASDEPHKSGTTEEKGKAVLKESEESHPAATEQASEAALQEPAQSAGKEIESQSVPDAAAAQADTSVAEVPAAKESAAVAAEVAESAQEVPEPKEGAAVAAEVAESANEVPDPKESAAVAAEVAESAQEVPEPKEAAAIASEVAEASEDVPDEKVAAETADEVAEVAKQVPEEQKEQSSDAVAAPVAAPAATEEQKDQLASAGAAPAIATAATAIPASSATQTKAAEQDATAQTVGPSSTAVSSGAVSAPQGHKHAQQSSVDLSGELYGNEGSASRPSATGTKRLPSSSSAAPTDYVTESAPAADGAPKKKGPFRAAIGAIRELLR